jgi:hypothetical protein
VAKCPKALKIMRVTELLSRKETVEIHEEPKDSRWVNNVCIVVAIPPAIVVEVICFFAKLKLQRWLGMSFLLAIWVLISLGISCVAVDLTLISPDGTLVHQDQVVAFWGSISSFLHQPDFLKTWVIVVTAPVWISIAIAIAIVVIPTYLVSVDHRYHGG